MYMLFAEDLRAPVDKRRFQMRLNELGLGSTSAYTAINDLFASVCPLNMLFVFELIGVS